MIDEKDFIVCELRDYLSTHLRVQTANAIDMFRFDVFCNDTNLRTGLKLDQSQRIKDKDLTYYQST